MLTALLALAAQAAAAPPSELTGIWAGNVGNLPVRACFVQRDERLFGAYYYQSRQRLIALEPEEGSSTVFTESGDTPAPRWQIERADATQLAARWTNGARTLAVRLNRLARMEGEESPCGTAEFHRPRLRAVRTVTAAAAMDGVAYSRLTLDHGDRFDATVETFALDGPGEATTRINAALGEPLAGDPPGWFGCIRESLGYSPNEGYFEDRQRPAMISRRWVSVAHHWDGYCGGAHPDTSESWALFDRESGRQVNLFDWLNAAGIIREGEGDEIRRLTPALRDTVLAGWRPREAPECVDVLRTEEFWNIGLSRRGIIFYPSLGRAVQSCAQEFTLPFARLARFLTPEGAAQVRALQAEPAAR